MKRILKIIVFGVILGLLLAAFQTVLQIDRDLFLHGYWILAPAIVIGALLFNVFYNLHYQDSMKKLAVLLDEGKTEEYILGTEKLLQTAKGESLRNILTLNLAAGYLDSKEYDKAVSMLEGLSGKHLPGSAVRMIHSLNLCMGYFYTNQPEKAALLYGKSQNLFGKYRSGRAYGGSIAALDVIAAIQKEEYERAEQILTPAKEIWDAPRFQAAFQKLDDFIAGQKDS